MKNKSDLAVELFGSGHNCAQSVLGVFCEDFGLKRETAIKLGIGFGAGLARKQEVCGALTGAIMVIGLKHGIDPATAKDLTYRLTQDLLARFSAQHGSYLCRELLAGCDLSTEAGQKLFKENDLCKKICRPCVADAVCILEEIL